MGAGGRSRRLSAAIGALAVAGSIAACSGDEAARDRLVEYVDGDRGCEPGLPVTMGCTTR
jgi:hypothetical protein